ncbi:hypothetical protein [Algoriphagus machipongonensis]|uniref:hypothetical protein n=1 Tax=Algoriphagus machipongonensis TaxID=388413 RepID=UPI0000F3AF70|nr:hypothetical protein [Algoriphagus machipongonensis]
MNPRPIQKTSSDLIDLDIHGYSSHRLDQSFDPRMGGVRSLEETNNCNLFAVNLNQVMDWLQDHDFPKAFEKEPCSIPLLLFVPNFSTKHLLFHYDGTTQSANLIKGFLQLFQNKISKSKATVISPSFIPKSRLKEEQELIEMISSATSETSFIKLNFLKIGDFWSYAVKHQCTLLVTSKTYQLELSKVLFSFYEGSLWDDNLSFYLAQ